MSGKCIPACVFWENNYAPTACCDCLHQEAQPNAGHYAKSPSIILLSAAVLLSWISLRANQSETTNYKWSVNYEWPHKTENSVLTMLSRWWEDTVSDLHQGSMCPQTAGPWSTIIICNNTKRGLRHDIFGRRAQILTNPHQRVRLFP